MGWTIDIPESLVNDVWAWYEPHERYTYPLIRKQDGEPELWRSALGPHYDSRLCRVSSKAYEKSCDNLAALKKLRLAVNSLSEVVGRNAKRAEEEMRRVSFYHGFRKLSTELVAIIAHMVIDTLDDTNPKSIKGVQWLVSNCSLFKPHVQYDRSIERKVKRWSQKNYFEGNTPASYYAQNVTAFHLSQSNKLLPEEIVSGIESLQSLETLYISARFEHGAYDVNARSRLGRLPNLKKLYVSNLTQSTKMLVRLNAPLKELISHLLMDNLCEISVRLKNEKRLEMGDALDEIFGFPRRCYPHVTHFEIKELQPIHVKRAAMPHANVDLQKALKSLPALQSLSLGSCASVLYILESLPQKIPPIKNIRLTSDDKDEEEEVTQDCEGSFCAELGVFQATLTEVKVLSKFGGMFKTVQHAFPNAQWVTEKSILEESGCALPELACGTVVGRRFGGWVQLNHAY